MDEKLKELYSLFGEAWFVYKKAVELKEQNNTKLKRIGEMPILYFGNIDKYWNSKLRVVTVGKNPSSHEYGRFEGVVNSIDESSLLALYKYKLDNYFENVPYCNDGEWFSHWCELLNELGVKYGKRCKKENTNKRNYALHTDFFSPIATKRAWNNLLSDDKKSLAVKGIPLWFKLIKFLEPDIIIMSWESKWHPFTPYKYDDWFKNNNKQNNSHSSKSFMEKVFKRIKLFSINCNDCNKKLLEEYGKCKINNKKNKIKLFCAEINDKKTLLVWIEGGGRKPLGKINKIKVGKCIRKIWEDINNICS